MTRRGRWTDSRLDDLNEKVDHGFAKVDTDIRELRGEMKSGFDRFDKKFDRFFWFLASTQGGIIAAAFVALLRSHAV